MNLFIVYIATVVAILLGAGILQLIPKLGKQGKKFSDWLCFAPTLDVVVIYFTAMPAVVAAFALGWLGLAVRNRWAVYRHADLDHIA